MSRADVTEDERKEAERVLYRYYMQWVGQVVENFAQEIFNDQIEDEEGMRERLEQDTDSALIYTHDQRMVLATSESVSDGESRLEDMGGFQDGVDPLPVLALLTFQADVTSAMDRRGMGGFLDEFDEDARIEWIKAVAQGEHGEELAMLWDKHVIRNPKDALPPEDE